MATWYETSISYDKMQDNGVVKRVTEKYLIDALSCSEAEEVTIEMRKPYLSGECTVKSCKRTSITEIFDTWTNGICDSDRFYLAKVGFITLDEKTNKEKVSSFQILVGATDFARAYEKLLDGMKGTMSDYTIQSLSETPVIAVYGATA